MSEEWKYDERSGSFRPSGSAGQYGGPVGQPDGQRYGNYKKQDDGDWFGWVLIGLLFFSGWGWWIGLILLINKLKDDKRRSAQRGYTTATAAQAHTSGVRRTEQYTVAREASRVTKAAKKVTKSPSDTSKTARTLQIVGGVLAAVFGIALVSQFGEVLSYGWHSWMFEEIMPVIGFFAGGGTMFLYGRRMQKRRNRIERYKAFMGERDYVTVEELMMVTGRKRAAVEKDVDYMLQKNLLGVGAFFDAGRGVLFRSADAYQRYLRERTRKENLTPKEANEGYSGALRAIREANDRIPDPVFSEKLDRMEEIAGKIFREVESHPEKQKQASTFFDYYLPTTLKLLGTYTEFEEAGIEGENLRQAKARIESIMDTLLQNFERQLDELYRSEAMDVDADIRVMENMLSRDLSSVERDFGLTLDGGAAAQEKPE